MAGSSSGVEQLPVMEEPVLKRKSGLFPPPESGSWWCVSCKVKLARA